MLQTLEDGTELLQSQCNGFILISTAILVSQNMEEVTYVPLSHEEFIKVIQIQEVVVIMMILVGAMMMEMILVGAMTREDVNHLSETM